MVFFYYAYIVIKKVVFCRNEIGLKIKLKQQMEISSIDSDLCISDLFTPEFPSPFPVYFLP